MIDMHLVGMILYLHLELYSGIQKTFRNSFQKQVSGILWLSQEEKYNSDWLQAKKNCFSESVQLPMNRWENCAYMCVPSDFIRFSGEKERLCGIFTREQALRYHRGECGLSQLIRMSQLGRNSTMVNTEYHSERI